MPGLKRREKPFRAPGRCCFRGLSMRLVSLWWELPPWLIPILGYDFVERKAFLYENPNFFRAPFPSTMGYSLTQRPANCR